MKLAIALLALAACADSDDARLDHAQILAVRADPPAVAPGQRARIDLLAGDDAGALFEAAPDEVTGDGVVIERTAAGWFATGAAPGAATLHVALAIDGAVWRADKVLVVGEPAANPRVDAMQVDGAPSSELVAAVGAKPEVTALGAGTEPLSYAWYASVGSLERYRRPTAVLDADARGEGHLVVVVRDAAGGVGWQVLPARIE